MGDTRDPEGKAGRRGRGDRRPWGFVAIAFVLAAVFVRLGIWQLDRLQERRAANEAQTERMERPPLRLGSESADIPPDSLVWRRVEAQGRFAYADEIIIRGRSLEGRPGVHVVTPLRRRGLPAVLVLRGWLPAADGLRADLSAGRPPAMSGAAPVGGAGDDEAAPAVTVRGIAVPGAEASASAATRVEFSGEPHTTLGSLVLEQARETLPYPTAGFFVHATDRPHPMRPGPAAATAGPTDRDLPRLVPLRELGEGRHLVYAIQWFSFAAIAVVGAVIYVRKG